MLITGFRLTALLAAGMIYGQSGKPGDFVVESGTRIPLTFINSVSTKNAGAGDRLYLETAFPILVNGRIVIPVGSHVAGTVTQVKKPGRVKGRGELYVRFDSLILPNGVTREFRARVGSVDGTSRDELDRAEGKIKSEGHKAGDAAIVGGIAATGASIGAIATRTTTGGSLKGAGIGAAAGAAAGMIGILVTRGPDASLTRGSTVEMVLDRSLEFSVDDLDSNGSSPSRTRVSGGQAAPANQGVTIPGRRNPLGGIR